MRMIIKPILVSLYRNETHYYHVSVLIEKSMFFIVSNFFVIDSEEMYLVQTLFSTDLVALVSAANRSTLRIFLFRRKKEIFTQTFKQSIVAVQMNQRVSD